MVGEIFQDNYGAGQHSFYGKFLREISPFADVQTEGIVSSLKVEISSSRVSSAEAIWYTKGNMLPETSSSVFIQGDIVRVQ